MNPGQKHSVVGCVNSSLGLHLEPLDLPRPTHRRLGSGRDTGEWEGGHQRAVTQGKRHAGREQRRRLGAPSPQPPPSGFSGLGAESWEGSVCRPVPGPAAAADGFWGRKRAWSMVGTNLIAKFSVPGSLWLIAQSVYSTDTDVVSGVRRGICLQV